MENSQPCFAEE
jgi:transcription elongation factor Elf1